MPAFKILALTVASCLLLTSCSDKKDNLQPDSGEVQADANVDTSKNVEIDKKYYQITYNTAYRGAVKVSYSLTKDKVNKGIKDRPSFYSEESLDKQYRTVANDYTNTGYDRGHLANDASLDSGKRSLLSTYSMANIVPMLPEVNRGGWLSIEDYERDMVNKFKAIDIINIVTYKTGYLLQKKPLEDVLAEKKFRTEKQKASYISKYEKAAERLEKKSIHLPVGFYKVISSKRGDYKECFYVDNLVSNEKQDHRLYSIDCEDLPK